MRVLHFTESFSPNSETFIYDYVTELERQGVDNHVVTYLRLNKDNRPFPNVHVVERPSRWHPRRLWHRALVPFGVGEPRTTDWPQTRDRLSAVVRRVEPDVIHAHFGPAGVMIAPVSESLDIPLMITLYGYDVSRLAQQDFWVQKYPSAFDTSSVLIGISGHICKQIEVLGGDRKKIQKWHLGVDLTDFEYRPANKSFDGQNVCCLHVGRLVEKKAPIDLVKAFKHAVESTKDNISLNLKIAGDGPLRSDLERKVQSLGLKGHVSVLGAVPHSQVSNLLSESNVYTQHCKTASDGDQEGQGVSFVEAAASGLPIISTRHNGLPDVILDGRTGYLVEEGDTKAMGEMIAQLAESPDEWRRLGKNGRRHIEENFDLRKQVSKMKDTISHFA